MNIIIIYSFLWSQCGLGEILTSSLVEFFQFGVGTSSFHSLVLHFFSLYSFLLRVFLYDIAPISFGLPFFRYPPTAICYVLITTSYCVFLSIIMSYLSQFRFSNVLTYVCNTCSYFFCPYLLNSFYAYFFPINIFICSF